MKIKNLAHYTKHVTRKVHKINLKPLMHTPRHHPPIKRVIFQITFTPTSGTWAITNYFICKKYRVI